MTDFKERYESCMLLHGVGDAMGYKNGKWEFNFVGEDIHKELQSLGGVSNLDLKKWKVSDDTVLHLAVAECLIDINEKNLTNSWYQRLVDYFKEGMRDMVDRAPGNTTIKTVHLLKKTDKGFQIPFNEKGAGCGASMRSPCIGLRFSNPREINELIEFAIESGRMTHHHPMGYMGAVAAALFTSYALQDIKISTWGRKALDHFEIAKNYIKKSDHCSEENLKNWKSFIEPWTDYLKKRGIYDLDTDPVFPEKYGVKERDDFYKTISGCRNWAGALGLDSVLIAYDGLLKAENNWTELCHRAMLHGGDNDSTGCLAGAWYGALYGLQNVPEINYKNLEYKDRLIKAGQKLFSYRN